MRSSSGCGDDSICKGYNLRSALGKVVVVVMLLVVVCDVGSGCGGGVGGGGGVSCGDGREKSHKTQLSPTSAT